MPMPATNSASCSPARSSSRSTPPDYVLKTGDSFAFKSTLPHAFRNAGSERCQILWVNTTKPSEVRDGA